MKIVLLTPPLIYTRNAADLLALDDTDNSRVPIGLYSLATMLELDGHDVGLINAALTPWDDVLSAIDAQAPDLVGITCMSHHRVAVEQISREIKQRHPACNLVLGGVHASFLYQEILERWPWIDYVAIGEAERSFPQLVNRLALGEDPHGIAGIAGRLEDGGLDWPGPAEPIMDLGSLPIPAEKYAYDIISTSRGCPFNCSFCCSPALWGRRVRERPVDHIIRELELMRGRHGLRQVSFKDETFTLKASRVKQVCQAMIDAKLNLWWTCDTRVDCLDEERLYWLSKAGCTYVSFGVESGSQRMLDRIDKRISLDKVQQATDLARQFGIHVRYYLIAGLPDETHADLKETLRVVEANRPHFVFLSDLTVSPGTRVFDDYAERNKVDKSIWFETGQPTIAYDRRHAWRKTSTGRKLLHLTSADKPEGERQPIHPFSEAELREAQRRVPDGFGSNYSLAVYLKNNNRWQEAMAFYEAALAQWPDFAKGRLDLGICLDQSGRLPEAEEQWQLVEEAEEGQTDNVILSWIYLGMGAAARGERSDAMGFWKRAHEARPGAVDPLRLIAERGIEWAMAEEAEWAAGKWAAIDPQSAQAVHVLGLVYFVQNALEDAQVMLEKAADLAPDHPQIRHNYAMTLAKMGLTAPAAKQLKICLKLNPDHEAARQLLDRIHALSA